MEGQGWYQLIRTYPTPTPVQRATKTLLPGNFRRRNDGFGVWITCWGSLLVGNRCLIYLDCIRMLNNRNVERGRWWWLDRLLKKPLGGVGWQLQLDIGLRKTKSRKKERKGATRKDVFSEGLPGYRSHFYFGFRPSTHRGHKKMRLSVVFELLLILLLIAFAAYGRVIDRNQTDQRAILSNGSKQSNVGVSTLSLKQATDNVNRYCTCSNNICNCCRDFHIPLVQLQGPGCASLQYLQGDNLAVQLSFGDNILTSTIVNGKSPKPVCVPLPGGFTKFCGRIYSIQRETKNHFKACLGLELQSSTELEASLRVSCFRFGPDGLKLRPAEPLPVVETEASEDDDDDDFFGLGSDEDDEDDDDDDPSQISPLTNSVPGSSAEDEDDDDDDDVLGFGALLDIITGSDETTTKKPKVTTPAPLLEFTIPLLTKPTSAAPLDTAQVLTVGESAEDSSNEDNEYIPVQSIQPEVNVAEDSDEFSVTEPVNAYEDTVTEASNKVVAYAKPGKFPTKKVTVPQVNKKPSLTSTSINVIETETDQKKKPAKKPVKGDGDDDGEDDEDDADDDDDILDDDDDDEEELLSDDDEKDSVEEDEDEDEKEETEQENAEDEDEKAEDLEDLDDDDDEAEDAVISALVYDEKENVKKRKVKKNQESSDADDEDYELGLSGLLARSRHSRSGRQSKVMRL